MLRVNTKPRHKNSPRIAEKSAPQFLQWLRGRECFVGPHRSRPESGIACGGKIEAAHVDHAGGKGVGTKVADRNALPLCVRHHAEQHRIGWRTFEARYLFDAVTIASAFWRQWPGRPAWERKLSDG